MEGPFCNVDMILHAGDVLHHDSRNPLASDLADDINALAVPILIARGNCDSDADEHMLSTPIMSPYVFLYVGKKRVMVLHGDGRNDRDLEGLIRKYHLSLLIHGHSHVPRIKRVDGSLVINPGTPTIPSPSSPYKKTVGVFDTKEGRVSIYDIDTSRIVLEDIVML